MYYVFRILKYSKLIFGVREFYLGSSNHKKFLLLHQSSWCEFYFSIFRFWAPKMNSTLFITGCHTPAISEVWVTFASSKLTRMSLTQSSRPDSAVSNADLACQRPGFRPKIWRWLQVIFEEKKIVQFHENFPWTQPFFFIYSAKKSPWISLREYLDEGPNAGNFWKIVQFYEFFLGSSNYFFYFLQFQRAAKMTSILM